MSQLEPTADTKKNRKPIRLVLLFFLLLSVAVWAAYNVSSARLNESVDAPVDYDHYMQRYDQLVTLHKMLQVKDRSNAHSKLVKILKNEIARIDLYNAGALELALEKETPGSTALRRALKNLVEAVDLLANDSENAANQNGEPEGGADDERLDIEYEQALKRYHDQIKVFQAYMMKETDVRFK